MYARACVVCSACSGFALCGVCLRHSICSVRVSVCVRLTLEDEQLGVVVMETRHVDGGGVGGRGTQVAGTRQRQERLVAIATTERQLLHSPVKMPHITADGCAITKRRNITGQATYLQPAFIQSEHVCVRACVRACVCA